jgi:hypothetical protein
MVVYSAGYAAIFALFWLMYRHAPGRRRSLALDDVETLLTRSTARGHRIKVALGIASITLVLPGGERWSGVAGWIDILVGPLMALNGIATGRSRKRLLARPPAAARV